MFFFDHNSFSLELLLFGEEVSREIIPIIARMILRKIYSRIFLILFFDHNSFALELLLIGEEVSREIIPIIACMTLRKIYSRISHFFFDHNSS